MALTSPISRIMILKSSRGFFIGRLARLLSTATIVLLIYSITAVVFNGGSIFPRWTTVRTNKDAGGSSALQTGLQIAIRDQDYGRISNATLGFEKVMAVGLRERTDKRDALSLMSALTGFKIGWVDGVRPSSIPDKALPFGIDIKNIKDNFLGGWRGHMNALREVVDSGVSSALIMEDDMDWDVHLKGQLDAVARGARHVLHERSAMPDSPYGDNWDVLWLGHCGELFPESLQENTNLSVEQKGKLSTKYIIKNDLTVPPVSNISRLVDWSRYPPNTRVVHRTAGPICSFAYAVSQKGARKLLYSLSINGLRGAFDNSLADLCRSSVGGEARGFVERGMGLQCVSINPTIFFHHKARGPVSGDSDIQAFGTDGAVREKGTTESIKWSMRLNLENMLLGKSPESQYSDVQ